MRSAQVILSLAPLLALAQDSTVTDAPSTTFTDSSGDDGYYTVTAASSLGTEVPVSQFLSEFYGSDWPAGATGAEATSLASALYAHEMEIMTDMAYQSAANDVYMAAATLTNSDAIISSLDGEGVLNGDYTTASWFVNGVPASAKTELSSVIQGFLDVQTSVLGAAATTGAGATTTGASATATATDATTVLTGTSTTASGTGASASTTSSSKAGAQAARATGGAVAGLAAVVAVGAAVLY